MSPRTVRTWQRWLGAAFAVVLAATSAVEAEAQTGGISGRVTSSAGGQGVAAAIISVQGTQLSVLSGPDGSFSIANVPVGNRTLVVTRIGFQELQRPNTTVTAGQPTVVNLILTEQALQLDAIIATGMVDPVSGRQSPITVGRVSRENMPNPVAGSMIQNLQGQVAGVTITRGSGEPGSEVQILLRSPTTIGCAGDNCPNTQPLIVVDGVILGQDCPPGDPCRTSTVNLESMDILSMEVVKGAAAASLYGSRANAGVINITTNRGAGLAQGQTQLSYRSEYGWQNAIEGTNLNTSHAFGMNAEGTAYICIRTPCPIDPATTLPYALGAEIPRAARQTEGNNSQARVFFDNKFPTPTYDNINNVWQPGTYQQHTFNLSQNTVDTNFFLSLNRNQEEGALPNNDGYARNSFRLNIDHRFLNTLSLSVSTSHSRDLRDAVNGSLTTMYTTPRDVDLTRRPVTQLDSIDSLCDRVNCRYIREANPDANTVNPLWTEAVVQDDTRNVRTTGSASLRWEPASWLNMSGTVSYDRNDSKNTDYTPADLGGDGDLSYAQTLSDTWNANAQAQLRRTFGDISARITFNGSMERSSNESLTAGASSFIFPGLRTFEAMNQDGITASSSQQEIRANGFFTDLALDYQGRYIGTLLVRRDGSSLFGPDERWQTYYRAAANWRISEEEWFTLPLDELSLRYSRGTAGGRPGFNYQYEVWNLTDGSVTKGQLGNSELKPSHTTENDVTIQAVAGRWEVIGTYAWQTTTDQLRAVALPGYFGYPSRWMNIGAVEGSSIELTLNGPIMQRDNFQWLTTVVADHSNSIISDWPRPLACTGAEAWRYRCEGHGLYEVWGANMVATRKLFNQHRAGALTGTDPVSGLPWASFFDQDNNGMYVYVGMLPGPDGISGTADDVTRNYQDGPGADGLVGIQPGVDGMLGTGDDVIDDLWGTQGIVAGVTYDWGIPFKITDEFGTDMRLKMGDGKHWNLGWVNNFRFGAFTVFAQMHAKIGGAVQNTGHKNITAAGNAPQTNQAGLPEELKKPQSYWTYIQNGPNASSFYNEDTSYLKLRQVSVDYRFQPSQLARFGLSNVGITGLTAGLIARNLFTWTNFSGWDPEVGLSTTGNSQTNGGTAYPPTRTYTLQFGVTF